MFGVSSGGSGNCAILKTRKSLAPIVAKHFRNNNSYKAKPTDEGPGWKQEVEWAMDRIVDKDRYQESTTR